MANVKFEAMNFDEAKTSDFDQYIDPDQNFYNNIQTSCQYFSTEEAKSCFNKIGNFSLIYFNCRSMKANFDKIEDFLSELNYSFDVIALTETWLSTELELTLHYRQYFRMLNS